MAIVIFPDIKLIEKQGIENGWTREQIYDHYCSELRRMNSRYFNSDGSQKSSLQLLKRLFG